jgi:hypothetical protein
MSRVNRSLYNLEKSFWIAALKTGGDPLRETQGSVGGDAEGVAALPDDGSGTAAAGAF